MKNIDREEKKHNYLAMELGVRIVRLVCFSVGDEACA